MLICNILILFNLNIKKLKTTQYFDKKLQHATKFVIMEKRLGLAEARRLFFKIRGNCLIVVKKHAFVDYPERGFSEKEVINLVRNGKGPMKDNNSSEAIPNSYLFLPQDDLDRECKLVILIEKIEIEGEESKEGDHVIVCSAYRENTI